MSRIFLLLLTAIPLVAASPAEIWTGSELKASAGRIQTSDIAGKTLGAYGNQSISVWKRAKSGQAELHKTKTDLIVIEDGAATLLTGGTIPDAHATEANEVRGSKIQGGESKKVSSGDIIRIPAGTPHQFLLEPGQTVSYFAVKLAR